jgi:hypothetical protein
LVASSQKLNTSFASSAHSFFIPLIDQLCTLPFIRFCTFTRPIVHPSSPNNPSLDRIRPLRQTGQTIIDDVKLTNTCPKLSVPFY